MAGYILDITFAGAQIGNINLVGFPLNRYEAAVSKPIGDHNADSTGILACVAEGKAQHHFLTGSNLPFHNLI